MEQLPARARSRRAGTPLRLLRAPVLAGLIALASVGMLPTSALASANPVQLENSLPGTTAWELPGATQTRTATPSSKIEGYASENSVVPGDVVHLHVSITPAANYRIEVYRLGWYQGMGGRLIACVPTCAGSEPGLQQMVPAPDPTTGYLDAGWPVTDTLTVGSGRTTGYYVAKLILTSGPNRRQASYVTFIVRPPARVESAILVQASVNTWEAYNNWGGKSLYAYDSTASTVRNTQNYGASQVSFNRPYGSGWDMAPFAWEINLVRFIERSGYDVSYQTDSDTDENPSSLLSHRLDVVSGHDEYWSSTMRNAYEAARTAGVNLAFVGGNIGAWQMRYANSDRTVVEYRSATLDPDPVAAQKTVPFSALTPPRPGCQLLGVGYPGGLASLSDPPRSFSVTSAANSNPWFKGTGLASGDTLFDTVGYEWDNVQPGCAVPPLQVLLHFAGLTGVKGSPRTADAVTYTAPSGARVFSDGSLQVAWALDDFGHAPHADARLGQLFTNIFNDLGGGAPTPLDTTPPAPFNLVSPAAGARLWTPRPRLAWTASSDPGSGLAGYLISIDGKALATTKRTSFTVPRDLPDARHTWSVTALDAAGNRRSVGPRSLVVSSVRIVAHSRAHVLRRGFSLRVYCARRCAIRISIRLGRQGPVLDVLRPATGPGVLTVNGVLTPAFHRALQRAHRAQLFIGVRTRSGHAVRSVALAARC